MSQIIKTSSGGSGGSGITSITGDSGGPQNGPAITLTGGTTGFNFSGSSSTITMNSPQLNLPDTTSSSVGVININGNRFMHKYGDANNVFVGTNAGNFTNITSIGNTALGSGALNGLTTGDNNIAIGSQALNVLGASSSCIAIGQNAMVASVANASGTIAIGTNAFRSFVSGSGSTAVFIGQNVAQNWTAAIGTILIGSSAGGTGVGTNGGNVIGIGANSLLNLTSGITNIGLGNSSLSNITTGINNTGIGNSGGTSLTTNDSNNLIVHHPGVSGDNNTCRIGAGTGTGIYQFNKTFISGVFGITVGVSGIPVVVDNAGQFGTVVSSVRYKENIEDLNEISSRVLSLRPVIFNYKDKDYKSYGLIAEEVNQVMPELVVRDLDDEIQSVKYQELPILLLNELQKAIKRIEELEKILT